MTEDETTSFIDSQRDWLNAHKAATGLSWEKLAPQLGIPDGTLSPFGGGKYPGVKGNLKIAETIQRYRQLLDTQESVEAQFPTKPGYFQMPTSDRLMRLFSLAQKGKINLAIVGAGISKTASAEAYRDSVTNCFIATLSPSSGGLMTMISQVLAAMGMPDQKGSPQSMSRLVKDKLAKIHAPLLIIDEVQEATAVAINEMRHWHDMTGTGLMLLGNEKALTRVSGGARAADFAPINSRILITDIIAKALPEDVQAHARAWGFTDPAEIAFLVQCGLQPGALRENNHTIELAWLQAYAQNKTRPDIANLRQAKAQREAFTRSLGIRA